MESLLNRGRPLTWMLLALAVVALAYGAAPQGDFAWDDHPLIEEQSLVTALHPPWDYFTRMFWSDPLDAEHRNFYRPLVTLSYALEYRLGGGSPFPFHVVNVLVHLAACALVFHLARRWGASPPSAAMGAALFGTHPRLTESVSWISGRTDLFAAVGALSALLLYWDGRARSRALAGVALALGLFSKEVALAALAGVVAFELRRTGNARDALRSALRLGWPLGAAVLLYLLVRLPSQLEVLALPSPQKYVLPWAIRPVVALQALGTYAAMLLDPFRPRLQIGLRGVLEAGAILAGAVLLAGGAWLAGRAWRRPGSAATWALLAVSAAALLPVLHLVHLNGAVVACDRYLYLPLAALSAALAVELPRWLGHHGRAPALATVALLAAFTARTFARTLDWLDEATLWQVEVSEAPLGNGLAHANLGNVLLGLGRLDEARDCFEEALAQDAAASRRLYGLRGERLHTEHVANLALCDQQSGEYGKAVSAFQSLVQQRPEKLRYRFNLALAQARALDFAAAETTLRDAPQVPEMETARDRLQALFAEQRAARDALPPAQQDEPASLRAERAALDDELGRVRDAASHWQAVLERADATAEQLRRGTGYLVLKGTRPQAEEALSLLARRGTGAAEFEPLRTLHAERWRALGPGGIPTPSPAPWTAPAR